MNQEQQLKLMVVDDEPAVAELIRYTLTKMPYQIRTASSGSEALILLEEEPTDILITDINMPDMNGLELTEKVLEIYPDTLVIALTGYGNVSLVVEFMRLGGIDFLQKPVNRTALRFSIESATERYRLNQKLKAADKALRQKNIALEQEIAEKKRSQEALQESELRYREVFENAPVGIYQSSLEGTFIRVNPAMARILGYASPDEIVSEVTDISTQIYIHPNRRKKRLETFMENNGWVPFKEIFLRKDKTSVIVKITARAVRNNTGEPLYIEGFIEDITEVEQQKAAFSLEMNRAKESYELIAEPQLPLMSGVGIHVKCLPAKRIGGDVLEILEVDEKRFLLFLADVTGHGIPAAMTASTLKILFKEIAEATTHPSDICRHLNKTIYKIILPDEIIAVFCGLFDLESMNLNYYLSGLPFPMILRNGEKKSLKCTGLPLGVFGEMVPECKKVRLKQGDLVLAFTDGIIEIKSENGDIFGMKGLKSSIGKMEHNADGLIECLMKSAFQFQQKNIFRDDVIVLTVNLFDKKKKPPIVWNRFCTTDKCIFKIKTKHISTDVVAHSVVEHIAEKSGIAANELRKLKTAFFEVLNNAVEHGSLEMTEFKNSECFDSEKYREIYENRKQTDKYGERMILIECLYSAEQLKLSVEDEGNGFDPQAVYDPCRKNKTASGRGIFLAKMNTDQLIYNAKGNRVMLVRKFSNDQLPDIL